MTIIRTTWNTRRNNAGGITTTQLCLGRLVRKLSISGADIMVVLNELKHIRDDVAEQKTDLKEFKEQYKADMKELREERHDKCNECVRVALLEHKLEKYDELVNIVNSLNTERGLLSKVGPYFASFLAWLAGGGWKYFVG